MKQYLPYGLLVLAIGFFLYVGRDYKRQYEQEINLKQQSIYTLQQENKILKEKNSAYEQKKNIVKRTVVKPDGSKEITETDLSITKRTDTEKTETSQTDEVLLGGTTEQSSRTTDNISAGGSRFGVGPSWDTQRGLGGAINFNKGPINVNVNGQYNQGNPGGGISITIGF